ncbi:MAG: NusG domain II-containing protein [Candidatus Helarchaeota archaeon]|nr:NusG domain II-containing protein [Candidatus Helarchaeota archaeon]
MKKLKIPDFALVVLLIVSGLFSSYYMYGNDNKDKKIIVELSGKVYGVYNLNSNRIIDLKGPQSRVKINIENGYVFVSESGCPQKICKRMGRKNRINELIVCIPNRLIIRIEGKTKNNYEFITR